MKTRRLMVMALALVAVWGTGGVTAQDGVPPAEVDTEAFLDANFQLQTSYSRVLCVSGDESCPAEVTVTVPCLTASCAHAPAAYPIAETFNTIQAAADAAQPGDLVIITPGRYRGVMIEETGGTDGAYIHFLGWGDPGSVIVDGVADPSKSWLRHHFYFIDAHYYLIQNLAFEGATDGAGIFVSGYFSETGHFAHHFIVMDVYSHDNFEWGLHTTSTNYVLIQDSVFTGSVDEHGAYLSGSGDNIVIRRNVFQGNNASGLQVNADPQTAAEEVFYWLENSTGDTCGLEDWIQWPEIKACYDSQGLPDLGEFFEDGISENLIIEQNVMTGNGAAGGGAINLASVRHSVVRNNLIYGNGASGIACWDDGYAEDWGLPPSEFGCQDVLIVHNTLVDETGNRGALILNQGARDMRVFNNIIVRDRFDAYEVTAQSGQGLQSGANAYFALVVDESPGAVLLDSDPASGSVTGFGVSSAMTHFVAPGFTPWVLLDGPWPVLNPDRPDYHPLPGSDLFGIGHLDYRPALDLEGQPRTGNAIGALAVGSAESPDSGVALPETVPDTLPESAPSMDGGGVITYTLPDGRIFRIEAREGAAPENLTQALDALGTSGADESVNVSPDGEWLLINTERFDPECEGWPCLALLCSDLSEAESIRANGEAVHPSGTAAVASGGALIVYTDSGGPHELDLWVITRSGDAWSAPVLLTADSPYTWNSQPAIAADGTRVLFDCGPVPYGQDGTEICEVGTPGSGLRVAIELGDGPPGTPPAVALHHADYAPNGDIVFESDWGETELIWRTPPDQIVTTPLNAALANDNSPCVLPDGRIVSLWLGPEGGNSYHKIKVMQPDGSAYFMALTDVDVLDAGLGCGG